METARMLRNIVANPVAGISRVGGSHLLKLSWIKTATPYLLNSCHFSGSRNLRKSMIVGHWTKPPAAFLVFQRSLNDESVRVIKSFRCTFTIPPAFQSSCFSSQNSRLFGGPSTASEKLACE